MYVSNNSDYIKNKVSSVLLLFLLEGRGGGGGAFAELLTYLYPQKVLARPTQDQRPAIQSRVS